MRQRGQTQEAEVVDKGFNIQVTYRDEKTGVITHRDPYIMHNVKASDGGSRKLWERPAGSGNLWDSKNQAIGRWVIDPKTKKGEFVEGAKHVAFTPPETSDQKLARSLSDKDARIAELQKELELIKAEKQKKQGS